MANYVHQEADFAYPQSNRATKLKALFNPSAVFYLTERRLAKDQTLQQTSEELCRPTAAVADTVERCWWPLGFGDGIAVLAPKALRGEFKGIVANVARK